MHRAILLFGYPGSGKGTQGKILNALPGFHHVAMGEIFRGLKPGNPLYDEVWSYLKAGNLVPDQLVMDLFAQHIEQRKIPQADLLVIDGIPRNRTQVNLLNQLAAVIKIFKLSVYNEDLVVRRMKKRAMTENRPDDASDDVIAHRLEVYRTETESCIKAYPGTILTRIQADQPVFDVHLDIMNALGKMRDIRFP
ncbi:MAG: nucleoside monophosphate kinase [Myxococcales bacterium]|nr:nucleoside monophosphate kinase [Myxococcales bacterium]